MRLDIAVTRVWNLVKNIKGSEFNKEEIIEGLNFGWEETAVRTQVLKKCMPCSITANQAMYRFPVTDYVIYEKIKIAKSGESYELNITPANTLERTAVEDVDNTGNPQYATITNREGIFYVKLDPTPITSITYDPDNGLDEGLWFWYIKNHVAIHNDSDEPELPESHQVAGIFYSAFMVSGAEKFLTLFERKITTLLAYAPEVRVDVKERVQL